MLTNTERQQIVEEVNAGTYGIDEALDDIAAAQKGEEVRKALYAEALVLNREGHAGSTDMIARQQVANLQTSVNGQISTLRTEVGEDIDDLETALNSGLATQNGKIAAQDATIANVVANYNVEYGSTELWASTGETGALAAGTTVTLSEDVSHFDYIDIYSFCGNSNVLDTVPVDAKLQSNAGYALRWVNLSDPGSGSYKAYVRIVETRLHIIGTTLTIDHQVTYRNGEEVNISGAEVTQSNRSTYMGEFGIMKIVGRKINANTEVTDIRTGADGTAYNSAGAAVRAQVQALNDAIPAVDATLSVQGAAADAKVAGDKVAELKSAIDELNGGSINLLNPADFQQGKYLVMGGGLSDNADLTTSGFFPVSGNTTYYFYRSDTYRVRVCFYTADSEAGYIYNSLTDISSGTSTFTTPATASYARISTNKNMILDMGIYASDIRYYIPYQLRLNADVSIENQIDNTLTNAKKAAPADAVGQIKSHVIFPENCIKYGDAGMITNERLDLNTGAIVTNSSGQTRTEYIPVTVGDYVQTCAIRNICLYNSKFEYLGYINLWSANDTVAPPESWSGNYNSNITQITAINGINPSYIRCWGRYDSYPPAVAMLSGEPYKVLNLGDSIFGNNEKPRDLGTYIQNITGMKDANCGYGGTTARVIPSGNMAPLGLPSIVDCIVSEDFSPLKTPAYWASLQEYRYGVPTLLFGMVDFSKIAVITIAYGTNDWNSSTPLDNADNRLDTSTYKGGLRYAVENLQTKYPAITLVMLSPIYRYWSNAADYSTVDEDSDTRTNNLGLKLTDYVTAMQEVAEEYHLPFYNNYDGIGLNRYTAPTWLRDGTHLNRGIGVDKLGHIVAKEVGEIY